MFPIGISPTLANGGDYRLTGLRARPERVLVVIKG